MCVCLYVELLSSLASSPCSANYLCATSGKWLSVSLSFLVCKTSLLISRGCLVRVKGGLMRVLWREPAARMRAVSLSPCRCVRGRLSSVGSGGLCQVVFPCPPGSGAVSVLRLGRTCRTHLPPLQGKLDLPMVFWVIALNPFLL